MKPTRLLMGALAALLTLSARSQEPAPKFGTTASLGATLTDGNSQTMTANASLVTTGEKKGLGSYRTGVEGNYGENTIRTKTTENGQLVVTETDETTIGNAKAFGNVKKTLTEKTFAYVDGSLLYDDIADVDYRGVLGPGLGVYLIKDDETALSVETGIAYFREKVAGVDDDGAALRLAERLERKLSETAKLWQAIEYLPDLSAFDSYLLTGEVGIEAAVNATLNLRLVLQDKYDNQPGAGLKQNDLALIAGISVLL